MVSAFVAYGFRYHDCNDPDSLCSHALNLDGNNGRTIELKWPNITERKRCELIQHMVHGDNKFKYIKVCRASVATDDDKPISVFVELPAESRLTNDPGVMELAGAFPGVRVGLIAAIQ